MSEEGTGNQASDGDLLPDFNLRKAAKSIAEASAHLELRQTVGRGLRGAIKHILEAQEKLEGRGTVAELRLDLLEAIRLIGAVEAVLKVSEPKPVPERPATRVSQPESRPKEKSRPESVSAGPRTEVEPAPTTDRTPTRDPEPSSALPPKRQSLSALATVPSPAGEASRESTTRRGFTRPPETAPPKVVIPTPDTHVPEPAPDSTDDSLNRRTFDRLAATYPIQLQPPYNGLSNSDLTQLPIGGITLNVGRGGMLAQIDQGILRHGRYMIRFIGAGQNVRPDIMWGRVRRSRAADTGWEVGIEFDCPLEILRPS